MSYLPLGRYADSNTAYEADRMRQADDHFAPPLPVCPWCGCESSCEDGDCDECGAPMDGSSYFECPYCGDRKEGESAHEGASCCKENHVELVSLTKEQQ